MNFFTLIRNSFSFFLKILVSFSLTFYFISAQASWVVHTGKTQTPKFFLNSEVVEIKNPENFYIKAGHSECKASYSQCAEKVYVFEENEIKEIFQKAKDKFSKTSEQAFISGSFYAALSILVVPVWGWFGGAITGGISVYEFYEGSRFYSYDKALDNFFEEQKQNIDKCGHLTRDFLDKSESLEIDLGISENNFSLTKPKSNTNSLEKIKEIYEKTIIYAQKNRMTYRQAYHQYYSKQCGLAPTLNPTTYDKDLQRDFLPFDEKTQVAIDKLEKEFSVTLFFPETIDHPSDFLQSFSGWVQNKPQRAQLLSQADKLIVHNEPSNSSKPYKIDVFPSGVHIHLYPMKESWKSHAQKAYYQTNLDNLLSGIHIRPHPMKERGKSHAQKAYYQTNLDNFLEIEIKSLQLWQFSDEMIQELKELFS